MSKFRLVGAVVIVLFLAVIIALGVISINLATVAQNQVTLTEDINSIKAALTQLASHSHSSDTESESNSTNSDSTSEETNQTTTFKECLNTTLGIKTRSVPVSWNCEDSGDLGAGQSYLTLTKGNLQISIGTPAIGFNCTDGNCTTEYLLQNDSTQVTVISQSGEIVNVSGLTTHSSVEGLTNQINVRTINNSSTLTEEISKNKSELITILSSITTLL